MRVLVLELYLNQFRLMDEDGLLTRFRSTNGHWPIDHKT